ncbi:MAG: glycosyltransferase [Candidatus Omnitrophica bacterium]|nr:glycosyltransferase [Candidatus Omnitrophota bacterium]
MKVSLSVIIPTLNEENNLERCLSSVQWADEVFVVDSGSTDRTAEIAVSRGARLVDFKFNGTWPKKYNWSLDNLPFSNEWVLILDADETIMEGAEDEFRRICSGRDQQFDGYYINRRFMFMGKWLKHAYYPNWNLRLFRHRLGRFEKLTDSRTDSGDIEIHEHLILNGKAGQLRGEMEHYAYPDVASFVEKHSRYATWEAHVMLDNKFKMRTASELLDKRVIRRRRLKVLSRYIPFRAFLRFLYIYFLQLGFLDGREGFYFARLHAEYEFLITCNLFELKHHAPAASDAKEKGEKDHA